MPTRLPRKRTTAPWRACSRAARRIVYVPTKEERLALKKAMAPVHIKMADRVGKEILQEIYKETGFDPTKL